MPCFQTQHMHAPVSQLLPGKALAALDSFLGPLLKRHAALNVWPDKSAGGIVPRFGNPQGAPGVTDCTSGLERLGCLDPRSASVAPGAEGLLRMHLLVHPATGLGILTLAAGAMAAAVADRGLHGKEAPVRCSTVPRALLMPAAAR